MTFFAALLFGAGTLLFVSALENQSLVQTVLQILAGNTAIASSGTASPTTGNSGSLTLPPNLPLSSTGPVAS